jgi:hypothetical protein
MKQRIRVGDRVEIIGLDKPQFLGKQGIIKRIGIAYDGVYAVVSIDKVKRSQQLRIDSLELVESMQLNLLGGELE